MADTGTKLKNSVVYMFKTEIVTGCLEIKYILDFNYDDDRQDKKAHIAHCHYTIMSAARRCSMYWQQKCYKHFAINEVFEDAYNGQFNHLDMNSLGWDPHLISFLW